MESTLILCSPSKILADSNTFFCINRTCSYHHGHQFPQTPRPILRLQLVDGHLQPLDVHLQVVDAHLRVVDKEFMRTNRVLRPHVQGKIGTEIHFFPPHPFL